MIDPTHRVLHVLPQFPYFGGRQIVGGYSAAVLALTSAQASSGTHVEIAARVLPLTPDQTYQGVPIRPLGDVRRAGGIVDTCRFILRAVAFGVKHRRSFDAVHVHLGYAEYLMIGALIKALTGLTVLQTVYCPPSQNRRRRVVQSLVANLARRTRLSGMSRNIASGLERLRWGTKPNHVDTLGIVIDAGYWSDDCDAPKSAARAEDNTLHVLFVGNATREKNLEVVIRAVGLLHAAGIPVTLLATTELKRTGGQAEVSRLIELVEDLNLTGRFVTLDIVDDMRSVVRAADVHVAPFLSTQGPSDYFVSTLEAMSMGKAVIASRLPGMSEVIDSGTNGWLIDSTNHHELAAVLTTLHDEGLRSRAGALARASIIDNFSPASIAERAEDLYGWAR